MLHSEAIFNMYLDYYNNYAGNVDLFAEHNLLNVFDAYQIIQIGRTIAYDGLKQYQERQL